MYNIYYTLYIISICYAEYTTQYTLYTVFSVVYRIICSVYCTGVDPAEIFINPIAIMNLGKFNR